jgi:hypothetical protein
LQREPTSSEEENWKTTFKSLTKLVRTCLSVHFVIIFGIIFIIVMVIFTEIFHYYFICMHDHVLFNVAASSVTVTLSSYCLLFSFCIEISGVACSCSNYT